MRHIVVSCAPVSLHLVTDPQGLVYDRAAEEYERGRTVWPAAVADDVQATVVLDLAAGTGKLTRTLTQRFRRVIAVEPLDTMRSLGERLVPEAEWHRGMAEEIPLDDASVGAAFVADAFHWFDPKAAVAELGRVIEPRGTLLVMFATWNGTREPELPVEAGDAIEKVSQRTGETGAPRFQRGDWRSGFERSPFGEFEERNVPFTHTASRDQVVAYYLSMSTVAARPETEREVLGTHLRQLLPDQTYHLRLRAEIYRTNRSP